MTRSSENQSLPNDVAAWWFACRCFGIQEKELNGGRRIAVQLKRAITGKEITVQEQNKFSVLLSNALAERFRRFGKSPHGCANEFADEFVFSSLNLYRRLREEGLDASGILQIRLWSVLTEHVFLPTLFVTMLKWHRQALGTELRGAQSWYLPLVEGDEIVRPIERVLGCWMRVAGLGTPYAVSMALFPRGKNATETEEREQKREAAKTKVKRWLDRTTVPTLGNVETLVRKLEDRVTWLDDRNSWIARFRLASAVQHALAVADQTFRIKGRTLSERIASDLKNISQEGIVQDDDGLLTGGHTFFAARLLQRRLKAEGKFDAIIAPSRKPISLNLDASATDDEVQLRKQQIQRAHNPGNWFLEHIRNRGVKESKPKANDWPAMGHAQLHNYILSLGVQELNCLLHEKKKG